MEFGVLISRRKRYRQRMQTTHRLRASTAAMLLVFAIARLAAPALAADRMELHGEVLDVPRGETIELDSDEVKDIPLWLEGVYAPELDQSGGLEARDFMKQLVNQKSIVCKTDLQKAGTRTIAQCF